MPLDHDDLILLARLLANHTVANCSLDKIGTKLMDYAERNHPGGYLSLQPLNLKRAEAPFYPGRLLITDAD